MSGSCRDVGNNAGKLFEFAGTQVKIDQPAAAAEGAQNSDVAHNLLIGSSLRVGVCES